MVVRMRAHEFIICLSNAMLLPGVRTLERVRRLVGLQAVIIYTK